MRYLGIHVPHKRLTCRTVLRQLGSTSAIKSIVQLSINLYTHTPLGPAATSCNLTSRIPALVKCPIRKPSTSRSPTQCSEEIHPAPAKLSNLRLLSSNSSHSASSGHATNFGVFAVGAGNHMAGWRYPDAVVSSKDFSGLVELARTAERGKLDIVSSATMPLGYSRTYQASC